MQIESPFGKIEVHFHRNNLCTIQARGLEAITINGVALTFHKQIAIIDGQWQLAEYDSQEKLYNNSNLNLRFRDWNRSGSPSDSARHKLDQWITDFLLADFNRGTYTNELNAAERTNVQSEINNLRNQITEANETITNCKMKIDYLQSVLHDRQ